MMDLLGDDSAASQEDNGAYKVLARKYRPSHFDELIGQDALVRTLRNAIETGRIAHAYMLTGVRGVGKTTTARIIAKALNYTGPDGKAGPTTGPTEDCEACQAITQDRHPDVMEMDAASRTGVDDIREILDGVRYAPVSARYKVYIIDEVHMLSKQAFNALLKTLEEPPPKVIFIFATTEIRKVPVTVLSRCQKFDLKRVDAPTLAAYYKIICDKEGVAMAEDALALIGQAADGSVRDGLSLLDQAIAQGNVAGDTDNKEQEISLELVQDMLGLSDRAQILTLLENALTGQSAKALEGMEALFQNGADPQMTLQDLIDLVHGLSRTKVTAQSANGNKASKNQSTSPNMANKIAELSERLSMPTLGRAWDILMQGYKDIASAPNPEKMAEMTLIRLAYASNLPDPAKLLKKLEEAQKKTPHDGANNVSAKINEEVIAETSMPITAINHEHKTQATLPPPPTLPALDSLPNIVKALEISGKIRLAADIRQFVHLVGLDAGQKRRIEFSLVPDAPKTLAGEIQTELGKLSGERWFVSVTSKKGAPPLIEQERQEREAYMREVEAHPLIRQIMDSFPGTKIETTFPLENTKITSDILTMDHKLRKDHAK